MKLTRTLLYGKQYNVIGRLLYILTYFIRCSEIKENTERIMENTPPTHSTRKPNPKMSSQTDKYTHLTKHVQTYSRQLHSKQVLKKDIQSQSKSEECLKTHFCSKCQQCSVDGRCQQHSQSIMKERSFLTSQCGVITSATQCNHDVRLERMKNEGRIPKFIRTPNTLENESDIASMLHQGLNPLYELRRSQTSLSGLVCEVCPAKVNDQPGWTSELQLGRSAPVQNEKRQLSPTPQVLGGKYSNI